MANFQNSYLGWRRFLTTVLVSALKATLGQLKTVWKLVEKEKNVYICPEKGCPAAVTLEEEGDNCRLKMEKDHNHPPPISLHEVSTYYNWKAKLNALVCQYVIVFKEGPVKARFKLGNLTQKNPPFAKGIRELPRLACFVLGGLFGLQGFSDDTVFLVTDVGTVQNLTKELIEKARVKDAETAIPWNMGATGFMETCHDITGLEAVVSVTREKAGEIQSSLGLALIQVPFDADGIMFVNTMKGLYEAVFPDCKKGGTSKCKRFKTGRDFQMAGAVSIRTDVNALSSGYAGERHYRELNVDSITGGNLPRLMMVRLAMLIWQYASQRVAFLNQYRDAFRRAAHLAYYLGNTATNLLSVSKNSTVELHLDSNDGPLAIIVWFHAGKGALKGGHFCVPSLGLRFVPTYCTMVVLNTAGLVHGTAELERIDIPQEDWAGMLKNKQAMRPSGEGADAELMLGTKLQGRDKPKVSMSGTAAARETPVEGPSGVEVGSGSSDKCLEELSKCSKDIDGAQECDKGARVDNPAMSPPQMGLSHGEAAEETGKGLGCSTGQSKRKHQAAELALNGQETCLALVVAEGSLSTGVHQMVRRSQRNKPAPSTSRGKAPESLQQLTQPQPETDSNTPTDTGVISEEDNSAVRYGSSHSLRMKDMVSLCQLRAAYDMLEPGLKKASRFDTIMNAAHKNQVDQCDDPLLKLQDLHDQKVLLKTKAELLRDGAKIVSREAVFNEGLQEDGFVCWAKGGGELLELKPTPPPPRAPKKSGCTLVE